MLRQRRASRVLAALDLASGRRSGRSGLRFLAALGIVLGVASCDEGTPGSTYDLSGRVTTELTEGGEPQPIGGALVRYTADSGRVHETTTGSDGRYELQVFTDTAFGQVRAEAMGFDPAERTVYFDNPERRIDLVLRPTPAPEM